MINIFEKYLAKQTQQQALIQKEPVANLKTIVSIPAYNEPDILRTLKSLKEAKKPIHAIEVIILINHQEKTQPTIKDLNHKTFNDIKAWSEENSSLALSFYPILISNFPKKHAGVGLARKLAMDEAVRRFSSINQQQGIICSLDADTLISTNYFVEIEKAFLQTPHLNVALPAFEHNLSDDSELNSAINEYELYLRYFKLALKYTGFPYAFHTIGSAFAVSPIAYVKQGGMNKKQGGEDFYFLQKVFQLNQTIELNQVRVFPSNRPSDRVPFGTGPAIRKIIDDGCYETYQPIYFTYLKEFFSEINTLFNSNEAIVSNFYNWLDASIKEFVPINEFNEKINEINQNSSSEKSFVQRFFRWFDAFKIIKYLNHVHLTQNRIPTIKAAAEFLEIAYTKKIASNKLNALLLQLKHIEETT